MSEENKQKDVAAKGGAHVARPDETKVQPVELAEGAAAGLETVGETGVKRNKYADKMNKKKRRLSKGVRIGLGVAIVALLIALGVFLVMRSRNTTTDDSANTTAVAMRGMLETYIEGDGTTAAKKREEVGKDLKGKVSDVLVEVGETVKKGDKLLIVNPTETRKELTTAEEELADAQRGVTDAQTNVTKAQTAVSTAQKNIGKTTVTAPFTGKIVPLTNTDGAETSFQVGQSISEGTAIGSMVNDSTMKLSLYFSYAYVDDIKAGQKATVSIPSAMSSIDNGQVDSVERVQKISSDGVKLFRVIVSLPNPGTLTKGMTATATVSANGNELFPAESGTLEYSREETVTAQVSGEITAVNGIDYYNYSSGAAIMRISSDDAQDKLKEAQTELIGARNEVTRAQKLVQTKQERIAELKKLIANATVTSPIDGVVVSLNATVEQEVSGTEALCVVADLEDIIVNANITATDVMAVQPGQTAIMTMYTMDGEATLTGIVESVAMEPSQNSGGGQGSMPTFPAVIAIDPIEGQSLSIGQGVNFKITTASSMDCLIVPSAAVVNTEDGTAVFAKPPEGGSFENALPLPEGTEGVPPDYVLVPVEVGIADAANTEILWGIEEGTTVYLAGPEDMYANMDDGMSVAVG